jgi:pimeloyl-ACP methyl ester carboxylesterase
MRGDTPAGAYPDALQQLRAQSPPSAAGPWISQDCRLCTFADGFDYTSVLAEEWLRSLGEYCGTVPVLPYSYFSPGYHFQQLDTWDGLDGFIALYHQHLPRYPCVVIPIGFSLGALVSLLASARLSTDGLVQIPAIILIAPFHNYAEDILLRYRELAEAQQTPQRRIPAVVEQLCGLDPYWRDEVRSAYGTLAGSRAVDVHVLQSPFDAFARTESLVSGLSETLPRLSVHEIEPVRGRGRPMPPPAPGNALAEVVYHLRLRDNPKTFEKICELLELYSGN